MPTVTADIEIEVEVWCGTCGTGLCHISDGDNKSITVTPCPDCLEKEREEGYDAGYDKGYEEEQR